VVSVVGGALTLPAPLPNSLVGYALDFKSRVRYSLPIRGLREDAALVAIEPKDSYVETVAKRRFRSLTISL
jgi:hypothetical protein